MNLRLSSLDTEERCTRLVNNLPGTCQELLAEVSESMQ
jgi:hypothetical protein